MSTQLRESALSTFALQLTQFVSLLQANRCELGSNLPDIDGIRVDGPQRVVGTSDDIFPIRAGNFQREGLKASIALAESEAGQFGSKFRVPGSHECELLSDAFLKNPHLQIRSGNPFLERNEQVGA